MLVEHERNVKILIINFLISQTLWYNLQWQRTISLPVGTLPIIKKGQILVMRLNPA
jgi:hypothetical protein